MLSHPLDRQSSGIDLSVGDSEASRNYDFCDTCRGDCILKEIGRNPKVQAKYEGFVLLKKVNGWSSTMRGFMPRTTHEDPKYLGFNGPLTMNHRRHSSGDLLDSSNGTDSTTSIPVPPVRSYSTISTLDFAANHFPWQKMVNIPPNEYPEQGINNNGPSECHRKGRKHFKHHNKLSRKKSRSQDNIFSRRTRPMERDSKPLNNHVTLSPSSLNHSLSRSEGSIHNVTQVRVDSTESSPGIIRAGVEELAKFPKKLFDKFSDEVGQLVFSLERWREEFVVLTNTGIAVKTATGKLELLVPYSQIEDVEPVFPYGHHHCLLIVSRKEYIFLQTSTSYVKSQWFHSILWKKNEYKCRSLLRSAKRPEVLLKELKNLVELSLSTPLYDHSVCEVPLEIASSILTRCEGLLSKHTNEVIITLAPLMENNKPSPEICSFLSGHCSDNPRSRLVIDMFTPVVKQILKRNVDFGKYPPVCRFVQDYFKALTCQNDGQRVAQQFVRDMHGPSCNCPHLRVLPNLVSVCTSAIGLLMESRRNASEINSLNRDENALHLSSFVGLLEVICEYDDWRPGLAQLLQPVPFPDFALVEEDFMAKVCPIIRRIGTDSRCQVHQMVVNTRDTKEGWLQLLSPSSLAACDKGETWTAILQVLITCCYRRKKFVEMLLKSLGSCMLLALRDNETAQDILCLMMEWHLVEGNEKIMQVTTTLQSTQTGKMKYQMLYERQLHLQELQQKGGPFELTLPTRSTDADVFQLLSSGPFGNLISLSLAFTRVTSACAEQLIKFPTLRFLNLWSTQFGDSGLLQICEHLHDLEVLNLCETTVTDKGLNSLTALKNLRRLNLNSTLLSLQTFELLKESLPSLQHVDVRYTDAWNADLEFTESWNWS